MRFFVVCDDDDIGGRIRAILLDRGFECPAAQQVGLAGAVSVAQLVRQPAARDEPRSLGAPVSSPESDRLDSTVVVVLLSEALERGLEAIHQVRSLTTQRILAVGPLLDTKLVLRAIREGANEYLDLAELDSEVTHALDRIEEQTGRGRFIGVWSATGGSGCSTLVVNLACALGQKPNTCALVDLKIEGGDLASLLDVKPNYSLVDISRNTDGMDYTVLRGCLTPHPSGLQLMASPTRFPTFGEVRPQGVARAVALLRHHFDFLVADLDRCLGQESFAAAQSADHLLCALRLDFLSVRRTKLMLEFMASGGISRDRIQLVATRYGTPGEIPLAEAEAALSKKIPFQIPEDPKLMMRATNNGEPVVLNAASSKAAKKFVEVATKIRSEAAKPGS